VKKRKKPKFVKLSGNCKGNNGSAKKRDEIVPEGGKEQKAGFSGTKKAWKKKTQR